MDPLPADLQDELADIAFRETIAAARDQRHSVLIANHPEHAAALRAAIAAAQSTPPASVGPFRILALLGEGGFGAVYRAQQTVGVDRTVALKVLRTDIDSRAVLARFELERQVLAAMNHDVVARFYEAGQAEGRPWFSMELVEGQPLTDYCDAHRLSIRDRLRLLLQVCDGVQHAHGKGIVHRDLKPGNVLVSGKADGHVAKIIDFGIARATDRHLAQSMQTVLGMVLGTPEYMAPEQCGGDPIHIDARTDVYALGVLLYELLTGRLPFAAEELPRNDMLAVQRVLQHKEPQKPSTRITTLGAEIGELAGKRQVSSTAWSRAVRGDLDAIVGRAMEKDQDRRYQSVADFAADLRRHLDHEPIVARPPSRAYRLRKFVRKYRGQVLAGTAIVVTAIGGAVVSFNFAQAEGMRAEENVKLAKEKGDLATSLDGKVHEFDQLAGVVLYDRAFAEEALLYPAWPAKVAAMEQWLRDVDKLLMMRSEIEATVASLRGRALPWSEEEQKRDREAHPRFAAYEALRQRVASLRHAQAIRDGKQALAVPELSAEQRALDATALNTLAWERVTPKVEERRVHGEEPLGLVAARLAASKAEGTAGGHQILDTLAWALLANGQDEEAKRVSMAAWDEAPADQASTYEGYLREIEAAVENAASVMSSAGRELGAIAAELSTRLTWTFAPADEASRFLYETLVDLLGKLGSLANNEKAAVVQRLGWANQIESWTLAHPQARHAWAAVRAAVAASAKYAGRTIELREQDVTGLVPIGENPVTGLWEFYELRSAWDGKLDPRQITIPEHRADGSIEVTGETGIVFVLLPGGTFTMGAQKEDPDRPNYDPGAEPDETPHEVTLSPFFMARHELTQGQWARLWTWDAAEREPSHRKAGTTNFLDGRITLAHPVEQVDWMMCDTVLSRHGLALPTEAQWEYGCRGGTTTPWLVDREKLVEVANLADATARELTSGWTYEQWRDGHGVPAPVGTFAANGFGLFDMHGNVFEWCRDWYGDYGSERGGDGLRSVSGSSDRGVRGGCFINEATEARSASRFWYVASLRTGFLGLRPSRLMRVD